MYGILYELFIVIYIFQSHLLNVVKWLYTNLRSISTIILNIIFVVCYEYSLKCWNEWMKSLLVQLKF